MDELFHQIGLLLLLFFHWLWSIREFLLFVVFAMWLGFWLKGLVSSGVKEALDQTVSPLLMEISGKLDDLKEKE